MIGPAFRMAEIDIVLGCCVEVVAEGRLQIAVVGYVLYLVEVVRLAALSLAVRSVMAGACYRISPKGGHEVAVAGDVLQAIDGRVAALREPELEIVPFRCCWVVAERRLKVGVAGEVLRLVEAVVRATVDPQVAYAIQCQGIQVAGSLDRGQVAPAAAPRR